MSSRHSQDLPPHTDVVVIGAGVVGASIGRELAARGMRATILDRAPGVGGGCSYANAGVLAPDHVGPLASPALLREVPRQVVRRPPALRVRLTPGQVVWLAALAWSGTAGRAGRAASVLGELATESVRLHRDLADQGISTTLRHTGAVDVHLGAVPRGSDGLLDAAALRAREPALGPAVAAGCHHDDEWTLETRDYTAALLDDARVRGADVRYGVEVRRLVCEDGRVTGVRTDRGAVAADHVVLASGIDARDLAAQAGLRLPLRGGRGYVVDVATWAGAPAMPVRLKDRRIVVTPFRDRVRVCGSIEFGPESRRVDLRRADALLAAALPAVPGLGGRPVVDRWAGERPCLPDGVPAIGASGRCRGLTLAVGHGMWGLILAPVTARLVSDEITEVADGRLPFELRPDRFTRGRSEGVAETAELHDVTDEGR
jgi:D-amino-acid dehydrogenase